MRNAVLSLRNFTWLVCALALTACTKTPVDVSSLGLKLSAPQLKISPFSQDMDSQGYAEIAGVCNVSVGTLYISLDKISWFGIPATTPYSGTAGSGTKINDSDCSDGVFDFFLTDALITSWTGLATNDIKSFYLHGEGVLGNTEDLRISGGNDDGPKMNLDKVSPRGYAGINNCEQFSVGLNEGGTAQLPVTYNLQVGGTSKSFFLTAYDCEAGTNSVTQDTLTTTDPRRNLFYKFSGVSVGSTLTFRTVSTALVSAAAGVTVRSATDRFLKFDADFSAVYKNKCLPISVTVSRYDGTPASTFATAVLLNITATDANLKIYSDNFCTMEYAHNPISVAAGTNQALFFAKYETNAPDSNLYAWTAITVARDPAASVGTEFDAGFSKFNIDLSLRNTITGYYLKFPSVAKVGNCIPMDLFPTNFNGAVIPLASDRTITPASVDGGSNFYKTSDCSGSPISGTNTLVMPSMAAVQRLYYKTTTSTGGIHNIGANDGVASTSPVSITTVP